MISKYLKQLPRMSLILSPKIIVVEFYRILKASHVTNVVFQPKQLKKVNLLKSFKIAI